MGKQLILCFIALITIITTTSCRRNEPKYDITTFSYSQSLSTRGSGKVGVKVYKNVTISVKYLNWFDYQLHALCPHGINPTCLDSFCISLSPGLYEFMDVDYEYGKDVFSITEGYLNGYPVVTLGGGVQEHH